MLRFFRRSVDEAARWEKSTADGHLAQLEFVYTSYPLARDEWLARLFILSQAGEVPHSVGAELFRREKKRCSAIH